MRRARFLVATVLLASATLAAQQQPPPRFRTAVDIVRLDVTVLDRHRQPMRDLKQEDFTVLVDGVEQPIVAFDAVVIPPVDRARAAWTREVPADVRDNQFGDPRLFIIVMDDATTAHTDLWAVRTGKEVARAIVDEMRPGDLATVVFTFNTRHGQDLTADRGKLIAAIEKFTPQAGIVGAAGLRWNVLDNLFKMIRQRTPGARTAVMWISPAMPNRLRMDIDRGLGKEREDVFGLISDLNQLSREARVANLPFYGFNIAGLLAPAPELPVAGALRDMRAPQYTVEQTKRVNEGLQYLAAQSGGRAIINTNALAAVVPEVVNELGAYYVLGYRATYPTTDRKTRRLRVRVNHPNAVIVPDDRSIPPLPSVRPVKATPDTPLLLAMSDILPDRGIPLKLATAAVATTTKNRAGVALALGIRQPAPDEPQSERVEVLTRVFTPDGDGVSRIAHRAEVKWARAGVESQYEVHALLDLKPGRYLVRTSVHSASRNKTGSVYADITIPDFRKERLSLSGVVLSAEPAVRAAPKNVVDGVLPAALTAERHFTSSQRVIALVRVYQSERKPVLPVDVRGSLTDEAGHEVWTHKDRLGPERFDARRASDVGIGLPLRTLVAGEYLLRLEAIAGDRRFESTPVRFSVR